MEVKVYSGHRLGCSVCPKKATTKYKLIDDNSSTNKLRHQRKDLKKSVTTKYNKSEKSEIVPTVRPKVNQCYCYNMEHIKREPPPKLLCSKRFENPITDNDETWLNEILEFRRENWFDCHSNTTFPKNIYPICKYTYTIYSYVFIKLNRFKLFLIYLIV